MELRGIIMNFETKNAHVFAKMYTTINCISFAEYLDTRKTHVHLGNLGYSITLQS